MRVPRIGGVAGPDEERALVRRAPLGEARTSAVEERHLAAPDDARTGHTDEIERGIDDDKAVGELD